MTDVNSLIITAIVPAGGSGKRLGSVLPKQFIELYGKPVIVYSLEIFQNHPSIDNIVISVNDSFRDLLNEYIIKYKLTKVREIVNNGNERQDSIMNCINSKFIAESDIIIEHDAVRPFLNKELIDDLLNNIANHDCVIPVIDVKDTIKIVDSQGMVKSTTDRSTLKAVQTPQVFQTRSYIDSFKQAYSEQFIGTDSSSLLEKAGYSVKTIEGVEKNFKLTTQFDFIIAERVINDEILSIRK